MLFPYSPTREEWQAWSPAERDRYKASIPQDPDYSVSPPEGEAHDWTIRDYNDWQAKVEYIRNNPVRAKLVQKPEDWPYSSASGKFRLDPIPAKFLRLSSGAKAQTTSPLTQGLKPLPPKEDRNITGEHPQSKVASA